MILRLAIRALAAAILILLPEAALGHSGLVRASPQAGTTVDSAPKEVLLSFSETLEPAFSSIEVRDAKGEAVHDGKASVGPAKRTQMRIGLKALAPGTYKVIWRVLSVDTHRSQGSFTFRVGR